MATQQSILSRILPRIPSPEQALDLLEILRELDLELDFGVRDGRAFLRAHEALESIKAGGAA
jgi:hypothetical protein